MIETKSRSCEGWFLCETSKTAFRNISRKEPPPPRDPLRDPAALLTEEGSPLVLIQNGANLGLVYLPRTSSFSCPPTIVAKRSYPTSDARFVRGKKHCKLPMRVPVRAFMTKVTDAVD